MKPLQFSKYITPLFITPKNSGSWFGYYNYSPLNIKCDKMLANRAIEDAVVIKKGMRIELGYYDIPLGKWHHIGYSDSFNWPQGCMLQWLPGLGNENKVIYNTSENNHNIAIIYDIATGIQKKINWSIYGLTPDGKKSIALDMERSHWCRAYHYESVVNEGLNVRVSEGDGIFEIDLINNKRQRIVAIEDIINIDKEKYFDYAKHWIEHIMISPSGKRFCFLHRFALNDVTDYETRLFIANIDGSDLQLVDGWRKFYWSHFAWNGDEEFVIYTREQRWQNKNNLVNDLITTPTNHRNIVNMVKRVVPSSIRKIMNKLIKGQTSYYQYYILEGDRFQLSDDLKLGEFAIDGHPSFTIDGKFMITDTYPGKSQYQHLILYSTILKKAIVIGKLYAGLNGLPGSCDLHPKLSLDNEYLIVDTAFNKKHNMILFKLNWDAIKKAYKN